jgi:hypothetical protein
LIEYGLHVIGSRISPSTAVRAGRVGLLLGLVVLIAAHLAGTVHGSAFAGPHADVGVAACAYSGTNDSEPSPEHEHHVDDHIDHVVDRPRASVHHAVTEQGHDGAWPFSSSLSAGDAQPPAVTGAVSGGRRGGFRALDGRSALALHCVWRQ